MLGNQAAQRIGITPHLLSRLTGSVFVTLPGGNDRNNRDKRINIGLNLKFNKKEEEIPGYTKKDMSYDRWMYSTRAVDLITRYIRQFSYVVEYLARNVTNDMFHLTEMFPGEEGQLPSHIFLTHSILKSYQSPSGPKFLKISSPGWNFCHPDL